MYCSFLLSFACAALRVFTFLPETAVHFISSENPVNPWFRQRFPIVNTSLKSLNKKYCIYRYQKPIVFDNKVKTYQANTFFVASTRLKFLGIFEYFKIKLAG